MRILIVGPIPPQPGGGPISRGQLAAAFNRAGVQVCVVAPITAAALRSGDRYAAAHPEVRIVRYEVPFFDSLSHRPTPEDFASVEAAAIEELVDVLVDSFQPQLLVAGREPLARYVPALARKHGLPSVLLARGNPTSCILDGRYPADAAEILVAQFRQFDRIISVSEFMTQGLRALGCRNVVTIPNAIDTASFVPSVRNEVCRRDLGIPSGSLVVLIPGILSDRKRPVDVAKSAVRVLAKRPDTVYVFAGEGPLRPEVERIGREAGIQANLRLPGWIEYAKMPDLMNLADVIVLASYAEGMARSYLEAMACERTLVASDIPPARELVDDGVNGLLFRVGDIEHLAQRTMEALHSRELRERVGREARRAVEGRTVERIAPLYIDQFQMVIETSANRSPVSLS